MTKQMLNKLAPTILVLTILLAAAPASAKDYTEPRISSTLLDRAWQWLASFWELGEHCPEGKVPVKQGGYIDPNGWVPEVDLPPLLPGPGRGTTGPNG